jgi:hypothetical protein
VDARGATNIVPTGAIAAGQNPPGDAHPLTPVGSARWIQFQTLDQRWRTPRLADRMKLLNRKQRG